jgi:coniferyl-aldehyde dehydrogenase
VEDARTHGAQVVELEAPTAPTMPAHVGAPTIVPAAPAHVAEPVTAAATHAAATHAAAPTTATLTPTAVASAPGSAHAAATSRQLAPTLLLDVTPDMRAMREEIFGPILPIVPYNTLSEAIAFVNRRERPLALYWFGTNRANRDRVLCETIAGGVSINDTLVHIAQDGLPFGGVGPSGQGHYHGELGFRQFSKQKPVFLQSRFSGGGVIRPPYKPSIRRVLRWLSHFI